MNGDDVDVLIHAPHGRDATVVEQVLTRSGFASRICSDLDSLVSELEHAAGAAIVTEEALTGPTLSRLELALRAQPSWSDFPFVVLATKHHGRRSSIAARVLRDLGNVILLERPINAETLESAVRSALRARRRQYDARRHLTQLENAQQRLSELNGTLERRVDERTAELEAARETLSFALYSAAMGTWEFDLASGASRRSAQCDRLFGYDRSPVHWDWHEFLRHVHPSDRHAVQQALNAAQETGSLTFECRVTREEQETRWIQVRGRVEQGSDTGSVRMAGVAMDVTEQRRTEDALRQAQKMEAIGQLTGGVAHDFNNLLTVIVGGLDMLIRRPDQPDRVLRLAKNAMAAALRGEQLTRQLLAFSRKQVLQPETLNPNRLLLEFEPLARRAAGEAISIHLDLDPQTNPIHVDPAQFESAVLNLVVNARDAMPEGGSIKLRSRNVVLDSSSMGDLAATPGSYVLISVEDNGGGIPEEAMSHIFEPFYTTKEVGKGSGLGLSQVYGFVRSAGGRVSVVSAPGSGTKLQLYFPKAAGAAVDRGLPAAVEISLSCASSGETVLLVEDDNAVLQTALESLEDLNYSVIVASDAVQALERIKGPDRIDVMFSDVVMPGGMNGAQLALEARKLRPELKILLTSGYVSAQNEVIESHLPVLSKPYKRDELALKLRQVLGM